MSRSTSIAAATVAATLGLLLAGTSLLVADDGAGPRPWKPPPPDQPPHDEVELVTGPVLRGTITAIKKDSVTIRPLLPGRKPDPKAKAGRVIPMDDVHAIRWREEVGIAQANPAVDAHDWATARAIVRRGLGKGPRGVAAQARAAALRRLQEIELGEASEALDRGELEDLERAYELFARAIDLSPARKLTAERGLGETSDALTAAREKLTTEARAALSRGQAAFEAREYDRAHDAFVSAVDTARRLIGARPDAGDGSEPAEGSMEALHADATYWLDRCRAEKREMVYGDFARPETLEPVTARKASERRIGQFLFESLVERTEDERFRPALAERWEGSADGLVWSFVLRRGAVWSDGTSVTAQDVLATIEAMTDEGTENRDPVFAGAVKDVLVEGTRRISVKLARPYYLPLSLFTFKVLPRSKLEDRALTRGHPFASAPLGSGPFVYAEGFGSRKLRLGRNDRFVKAAPKARAGGGRPAPVAGGKRPLLNGVILRTYADRNAARNDLEKGALNLLAELRPLDVEFFSRQRGFRVVRYRSRTISFLAFNHRNPILASRGVRQAISHAVDRETILEQYFSAANLAKGREGLAHALVTGPFPRGSWAYDETVEGYAFDIDRAEEVLKRTLLPLGWRREGSYWEKEGRPLELTIKFGNTDRSVEQAVNYIRKNLRQIGIRARLAKKGELDLRDEVLVKQDFEIVYWQHAFHGSPDPLPLFDTRRTGSGGTNFSGYVNPAIMERFAGIQRSADAREILRLTHDVHRLASEDCSHAFLWQLDRYAAHTASLKGVRVHPYFLFDQPEEWKLVRDRR